MLAIRLTRVGKKNSPAYRVVVADKRRAVKRKFIEIIGNYNPTLKPKVVVIDKDRAVFWMNYGAQPSDTVRNLMCNLGILDKKERVNKVYGKKLSKKAMKEGGEEGEKKAAVAEGVVEGEAVAEGTTEEPTAEAEAAETTDEPAAEAPAEETPEVTGEAPIAEGDVGVPTESVGKVETEAPAEAEPAAEEAPKEEK